MNAMVSNNNTQTLNVLETVTLHNNLKINKVCYVIKL